MGVRRFERQPPGAIRLDKDDVAAHPIQQGADEVRADSPGLTMLYMAIEKNEARRVERLR